MHRKTTRGCFIPAKNFFQVGVVGHDTTTRAKSYAASMSRGTGAIKSRAAAFRTLTCGCV
jgi:hypothetical protein